MKTGNLFVLSAAVLALLAGSAVAQVDVKPGGTVIVSPGTVGAAQGTVTGGVATPGYYSTYPTPYSQGYQVMPSGATYTTGRFGLRRYSYASPAMPMPAMTAEGTTTTTVPPGMVQTVQVMPSTTTYSTGRFGLRRASYSMPTAPMVPTPLPAAGTTTTVPPAPMPASPAPMPLSQVVPNGTTVMPATAVMPSTTYNTGRFGLRRASYYTPAAPMAPTPTTAACCGAAPMPGQPVAACGDCGCPAPRRGLFRRG